MAIENNIWRGGGIRRRLADCLVVAGALGWVHEPEHIELVEGGERDEQQVPDHQDDAVPLVELPAVGVSGEHEEHHGGQQRQRRVRQTCNGPPLTCCSTFNKIGLALNLY